MRICLWVITLVTGNYPTAGYFPVNVDVRSPCRHWHWAVVTALGTPAAAGSTGQVRSGQVYYSAKI